MTNCKCGKSLRKGERECDECMLLKYNLKTKVLGAIEWQDVIKALRRAEKAGKNTEGKK